jgi:hypothetical protein
MYKENLRKLSGHNFGRILEIKFYCLWSAKIEKIKFLQALKKLIYLNLILIIFLIILLL